MRETVTALLMASFLVCGTHPVSAKDIAVCGGSKGYAFYPKAGAIAGNEDAGKWAPDAITGGSFTLAQISEKEFDLLVTDASGRVYSAVQDGAVVVMMGAVNKAVSVVFSYPKTTVTESYTFLRNADGNAEAIWTSQRGGGVPILKAAAYRADCSYFAF